MLLVTNTGALSARFGDKKAIEMFAAAGFDALDCSLTNEKSLLLNDGFREYAAKLRKFAEDNGIFFVQAHAPMPYANEFSEFFSKRKYQTITAMESASILGATVIIVHPLQWGPYKDTKSDVYDINMSFYKELIPYAEKFGIKIACENIFQTTDSGIADGACADPREFNKYIDDIANPYFTACLDIGHCNVTGRKAQNVLRTMGANRITALHIHDNDGFTDLHHLPLTVSMEWDEICKAIAEIGYKGNFTYEADGFLNAYSDEFIPTALKFMHDTGRYLISNIMNKQ